MIVELIERSGSIYIRGTKGTDWYVCAKGIEEDFEEYAPANSYQVVEVPNSLKPEEIVELSKSGIRADEIIRLRQAGVL